MSVINRRPVFQAVRELRGGKGFSMAEVRLLDAAIDEAIGAIVVTAPRPTSGRRVSQRGIDLIHSFETCKLKAYPDPGSRNGEPWTIGWGSTGADIKRGTVWTQEQADERFAADLDKFSARVNALLAGSPTTQHQFDAMVSLAYNIGIGSTDPDEPGGFTRSTVLRRHRAGDYLGAANAFVLWNKNDGKVMRGLTRRRLAEADLYDDPEGVA